MQNLVWRQTKFNSYGQYEIDESRETPLYSLMRWLCLPLIVTLIWKQMECRPQNPKKTRTEPLVRGAFVSRGADYVYAQNVQRLQLVLISRTKDINLPRNMRLKPVASLKVRKNGQQKACNLYCNIAAKRDERRCCAFYHPRSNLLTTWFVARQVWCGW